MYSKALAVFHRHLTENVVLIARQIADDKF